MGKQQRHEIAAYFDKYPDVPREVIIKEDILRLGLQFSEAALKAAKGCQEKSYFAFTWDSTAPEDMQKQEYLRAPQDLRFKGGPYDLLPIIVSVRISSRSPYLVDVIEDKIVVSENGTPIAEVDYPPRPKYYSMTFDDGTSYREFAPLTLGGGSIFLMVLYACQFWGTKHECKFCDINQTAKRRKKFGYSQETAVLEVEKVAEAVAAAFNEAKEAATGSWGFTRLASYHLSGGTITTKVRGLGEVDFYIQYVKATKEKAGSRWPCVLQIGAQEEDDYKRLRDAGVDAIHSNFEVWGKNLFKLICPGKDKLVGWDEYVRRVVKSVDIFGEGNVNTSFVAGVEMAQPFGFKDVDAAVRSTSEGLDYLMSQGVTPRMNSWVIEPLSALKGQEPPPLDYFIRISKAWYELWKKHNLPPVRGYGPLGVGRACWYHSSHNDWGRV